MGGAGGMRPVQSPLAGIAAPRRGRTSFGSASGSGVWEGCKGGKLSTFLSIHLFFLNMCSKQVEK